MVPIRVDLYIALSAILLFVSCGAQVDPVSRPRRTDLSSLFANSASLQPLTLETLATATYVSPTRQMPDHVRYVGDSLELFSFVDTYGLENIEYRWYKDGNIINSPLVISESIVRIDSVALRDAGVYQMDIFMIGEDGESARIYTDAAIIRVRPASERPAFPEITFQSESINSNVNRNHFFEVVFSGNPTPTVQWFRNGNSIAGETNSVIRFNSLSEADAGTYHAVVSNPQGEVRSNNMRLDVDEVQCDLEGQSYDLGQIVERVACSPPAGPLQCVGGSAGNPTGAAFGQRYIAECLQSGSMRYNFEQCSFNIESCLPSDNSGDAVAGASCELEEDSGDTITIENNDFHYGAFTCMDVAHNPDGFARADAYYCFNGSVTLQPAANFQEGVEECMTCSWGREFVPFGQTRRGTRDCTGEHSSRTPVYECVGGNRMELIDIIVNDNDGSCNTM